MKQPRANPSQKAQTRPPTQPLDWAVQTTDPQGWKREFEGCTEPAPLHTSAHLHTPPARLRDLDQMASRAAFTLTTGRRFAAAVQPGGAEAASWRTRSASQRV